MYSMFEQKQKNSPQERIQRVGNDESGTGKVCLISKMIMS